MQAIQRGGDFPINERSAETAQAEAPYGWVLNPVIDLLFCCGGLLWILFFAKLLVAGPGWSSPSGQFIWFFNAAAIILLADAHAPATLHRVYANADMRKKLGKFSNGFALLFGATFIASICSQPIALFFYKIYLFLIIQHYINQSYGIALLYCFKRNYFLQKWEKDLLFWTFQATLIFAWLRMLTYKEYNTITILGMRAPFWGPLPEWILAALLLFCKQ